MPQEEETMKMEKTMRQRRSTTMAANFQSFSASELSSSASIRRVMNFSSE